ncbi:putative OSM1-fumarate reductase [Serendipita vermifera]|nr:putative OSM1-fumarate reductase [Serendipita vermifera]
MSSNRVIVVGGGLAGLSAAHTLLERGASVLLLDKQGFMGGNSTKATSGINGAGTNSQHALGIQDSAQIFFDDTKKSAKDLARDDLIRVLTGNSASAVHWLQGKFNLDLSKVSRLGGHSQQRTHRGGAQFPGMVITYAQLERLEDLAVEIPDRVQILKKATVTKLLKEGETVVGVEFDYEGQKKQEYGPVILATGGYAADFTESSLLRKYRPELWELPTTNGEHSTGDGHKMAIDVGAAAIDMEKVQVHPTGLVDPKDPQAKVKFLAAEALRGVGGILLDAEGQRFADELGTRDYVTGKIWDLSKAPGGAKKKYPVRLLLNGEASKEIEWHCKHYVGRGLMKRFESGEAVAKEMGIDPSVLQKTFEKYNAGAKSKNDPFGKKFFHGGEWKMNDFFHVALMTPVLHYTMGGLEIDPESRVIDTHGTPIPGLFAAGEVGGGVHGANRLGGSSLLGCVVFGRVAGDSAAAYLLQNVQSSSDKASSRLGAVAGHLLETKVTVDPENSKVNLEFSWAGKGGSTSTPTPSSSGSKPPSSSTPSKSGAGDASGHNPEAQGAAPPNAKAEEKAAGGAGQYTAEEVAKHNTKDDCWVIIDGQVLDVTKFLPDHPGGEKAILLYAGRDATEEFNMLHDMKVIPRYAPDAIIGVVKN